MALSGSFSGSIVSGHYKLRVDWSATQSVANNTSKITAVMYLINDWRLSVGTRSDNSTSIAGTAKTWSSPAINGTGTTKLGTVTSGNITHNADGTKSVTISATYYVRATISGTYYEKITASATVTLNTIPRATTPTLSASSADMGASITISTPRASSAFTHDLAYSFAGGSYVSIATGVATSKTWTVADVASKIPNATSGTMTIRCITKNGSTTIGTKTVLLTAKVPSSVVPTISAVTATEATSGLAAQFGAFIQSKSKIKAAITAAGAKDSTIKSYSTTFNGKTYSGSSWTSSAVSSSGTLNLVTTVTDSRGRTAKKTTSISVLAYAAPKIYSFSGSRRNSSGAADDSGTLLTVKYNYAVQSLGSKNTAQMKIEYKQSTATEWTSLLTGTSLSANTSKALTSPTFSVDYQYDLRMTVTDYFGASSSYTTTLPSGAVILDVKADGQGIALGKTADKAGVDFGWSAKGAVLGLREATGSVPSDGDLNDYLQPGVYEVSGDTATETMANHPLPGVSGTLVVRTSFGQERTSGAWAYLTQEYKPRLAERPAYERSISSDSTGAWSFGDWIPKTLARADVIWTGARYMTDGHTVSFPDGAGRYPTGVVLVFSRYENGAALDSDFHTFFVPKQVITSGQASMGIDFIMTTTDFGIVGNKLLFIGTDKISGYANNNATGTGASGITYNNKAFVLRAVYGV